VIFGDVASAHGTNGTIPWRVATQQFVRYGSISPSSVFLRPGASRTVTVRESAPSSPGDGSGSVILRSSAGGNTSIPVVVRSLINVAHGGRFNGVLTGGNGRPNGEGQQDYYEFKVAGHVKDITANVSLTNDAADPVGAYLISPDGDALGYAQNSSFQGIDSPSLTANTLNPVHGIWTLVIDFAEPIVGDEVSQPFTGNVAFNTVRAHATGLPGGVHRKLAAGVPVTVPVTISNHGATPEDFFLDPRLDSSSTITLAPFGTSPTGLALPLVVNPPDWLVPSQTSTLAATSSASLPVMFDWTPNIGDPDLSSSNSGSGPLCSTTESGSYSPSGHTVTPGVWFVIPSECGPYPAAAPAGTVNVSMTATTKAFDTTMTSETGDLWLASVNPATDFEPINLNPGDSFTIPMTITPTGASGTVVRGHIYVDDVAADVPPYGQLAGNELAALKYAYTIK
jgi:hypothetical protein